MVKCSPFTTLNLVTFRMLKGFTETSLNKVEQRGGRTNVGSVSTQER